MSKETAQKVRLWIMNDLKKYCEKYDVSFEGCKKLMKYLISTGWNQTIALAHVKELIESGIIDQLKKL